MRLNVKDRMKKKGLNRNQFAKLVQIGYPAACAIYDGTTTRISFDVLESICRVLECTPNEIILPEDPQVKRLLAHYNGLNKINSKGKDDSN